MLRIYFLLHGFNLSDPALEDALCDSSAMCCFAGMDLGREPAPDETTLCRSRHLHEKQALGEKFFTELNSYLADRGG